MDGSRTRRGFTLVELMITVALIGIIGLIATPAMLQFIPNYRINSATKVLATEAQLARMRAIAKNNSYTMDFDPTFQDIDIKEETSSGTTLIKSISFATEFENVSLGFNGGTDGIDGNAITRAVSFGTAGSDDASFLPNGMLSAGGVFYLIPTTDIGSRSDRMRAVQLSRSGQVSLYRYDASASPPWREI